MDVVRKMVTAYDDFIMPGTLDYAGLINSPTYSQTEPPWPVNSNLETILDHTQPDIRQDLISKEYDPSDLERFMIKIERDRVNFGVLLMGHGNGTTVIDVSSQPDSFDKKNLYDVTSQWVDWPVQYGQGEAFTDAISKALAQLYNSRRAQDVSERIIIMLFNIFIGCGPQFLIDTEKIFSKPLSEVIFDTALIKANNLFTSSVPLASLIEKKNSGLLLGSFES